MLAPFACQHTPKLNDKLWGLLLTAHEQPAQQIYKVRELHFLINLHVTAQLDFE